MWQLTETMLRDLASWAETNKDIEELWLFGSQARGDAGPYSDVDLAIVLKSPIAGSDLALADYFENADRWQYELGKIVGRNVTLEAIRPNTPTDRKVRAEGRTLWTRR
jgi:predicted nucleotidyltransferase